MRLEGFEPPANGLEGRRSSAELQARRSRLTSAWATAGRSRCNPRPLVSPKKGLAGETWFPPRLNGLEGRRSSAELQARGERVAPLKPEARPSRLPAPAPARVASAKRAPSGGREARSESRPPPGSPRALR